MSERPLTLLHTADVHLGATFPGLGEKGPDHREQLKRTLGRIVDLAIAEPVDLVLIAGDLFHSHRQHESTLAFVREQLARLGSARVRVALLAGNHDPLVDDGVWTRMRLDEFEHVTLFGATPAAVTYPDLDLTVIGQSIGPDGAYGLREWPTGRTTRFAVGLAHGSAYREGVVDAGRIHPQDIRALGLDYLALGDWHTMQQVTPAPAPAWYAGSPEFLAMNQEGGHVLRVTLPAPRQAHVEPIPVGRRRYRRVEIDASDLDLERLRSRLAAEVHPDAVLDVVLTGGVPPTGLVDVHGLEEEFGERCFRLRLRDQRRVWLDDQALRAFPERTLVGRYIRLMRERSAAAPAEERPVIEEALQVGLALLLSAEGA